MKEVVNDILAAEKKVEQLLSETRQQASQIRQESEKKASATIAAAQEKARELIRTTVAAARSEAQQSREKTFVAFREKQESLLDRHHTAIAALIADIVAMITAGNAPESR